MLSHQNKTQFFGVQCFNYKIKTFVFSDLQVTHRLVKFQNDKIQRPSMKCI